MPFAASALQLGRRHPQVELEFGDAIVQIAAIHPGQGLAAHYPVPLLHLEIQQHSLALGAHIHPLHGGQFPRGGHHPGQAAGFGHHRVLGQIAGTPGLLALPEAKANGQRHHRDRRPEAPPPQQGAL